MSDNYNFDPPGSMRAKPDWRVETTVISGFVVLGAGPPFLAWLTGEPAWLWGWAFLLILWLAG